MPLTRVSCSVTEGYGELYIPFSLGVQNLWGGRMPRLVQMQGLVVTIQSPYVHGQNGAGT